MGKNSWGMWYWSWVFQHKQELTSSNQKGRDFQAEETYKWMGLVSRPFISEAWVEVCLEAGELWGQLNRQWSALGGVYKLDRSILMVQGWHEGIKGPNAGELHEEHWVLECSSGLGVENWMKEHELGYRETGSKPMALGFTVGWKQLGESHCISCAMSPFPVHPTPTNLSAATWGLLPLPSANQLALRLSTALAKNLVLYVLLVSAMNTPCVNTIYSCNPKDRVSSK